MITVRAKRLTALLLVLAMIMSLCPAAFAESDEQYGILPVRLFNADKTENLKMMVRDGCVYVSASMLAQKFGYECKAGEGQLVMYRKSPQRLILFRDGSEEIKYINCQQFSFDYSMPFKAVENEKDFWVPFVYVLRLLDSGYLIDSMAVTSPSESVLGTHSEVSGRHGEDAFDIMKDLGVGQWDIGVCELINIFNGWINLDANFLSNSTMEAKYLEDIATLICTSSKEEMRETAKKIDFGVRTLESFGDIEDYAKTLGSNFAWKEGEISKLLERVKAQAAASPEMDQFRKTLETASKKASDGKATSEELSDIFGKANETLSHDKLNKAISVAGMFIEFGTYYTELKNQDKTTLQVMNSFTDDRLEDGPECMTLNGLQTLEHYVNSSEFEKDMLRYSLWKTLYNNSATVLTLGSGINIEKKLFGSSGILIVLGWDLASNYIPLLKKGMDNADKKQLAMYAQTMQTEAYLWYLDCRNEVMRHPDSKEAWNKLAQSTYLYLKMCHICRQNGIDIVSIYIGKSDSEKNQLKASFRQSLEAADRKVIEKSGIYYLLSNPYDECDYTSCFGMIPPVEAEAKKEYEKTDAKIIEQIIFGEDELVGDVVSYRNALYYWKQQAGADGAGIATKLIRLSDGREKVLFDTESLKNEWDMTYYGAGRIAVANDKVFFTVCDIDGGIIYSCDLDGKHAAKISTGDKIIGLSSDNRTLVSEHYPMSAEPDDWYYVTVDTVSGKSAFVKKGSRNYSIWMHKGFVYHISYNESKRAVDLYRSNPDGSESTKLGSFQTPVYDEYAEPLVGQAVYPVIDDNEYVYFSYGTISGTGLFFGSSRIARARLDGGDYEVLDFSQDDDLGTLFYVDKNGKVNTTDDYLTYDELMLSYYFSDNTVYSITKTSGVGAGILEKKEIQPFADGWPKDGYLTVESVDIFGSKVYVRMESRSEGNTMHEIATNGGILVEKDLDRGQVKLIYRY